MAITGGVIAAFQTSDTLSGYVRTGNGYWVLILAWIFYLVIYFMLVCPCCNFKQGWKNGLSLENFENWKISSKSHKWIFIFTNIQISWKLKKTSIIENLKIEKKTVSQNFAYILIWNRVRTSVQHLSPYMILLYDKLHVILKPSNVKIIIEKTRMLADF